MPTRLRSAAAAALLAVAAAPALAAPPEGGGGLPQLNPANFPPQIFWAAVTFVALYLLMSRLALPRIAQVLEARSERIGEDLDKAAQLQQESETAQAAYERSLAEARTGAVAQLREADAAIAAANAEAQARVAAELAEQARAAETRIAAARDQALENVRDVAVEVAQAAVARLVGREVEAGRVRAAVETAAAGSGR